MVGREARGDAFVHALIQPVVRRVRVAVHNKLAVWHLRPIGTRSQTHTHELDVFYLAFRGLVYICPIELTGLYFLRLIQAVDNHLGAVGIVVGGWFLFAAPKPTDI